MTPFPCFKNNKVILVQDVCKWAKGLFSLHLLQLQNVLLDKLRYNCDDHIFISNLSVLVLYSLYR